MTSVKCCIGLRVIAITCNRYDPISCLSADFIIAFARDASRADTIANNCYDSFLSTSESWHNTPLIVLTVNECWQYNMVLIVITFEEYKVLLVN